MLAPINSFSCIIRVWVLHCYYLRVKRGGNTCCNCVTGTWTPDDDDDEYLHLIAVLFSFPSLPFNHVPRRLLSFNFVSVVPCQLCSSKEKGRKQGNFSSFLSSWRHSISSWRHTTSELPANKWTFPASKTYMTLVRGSVWVFVPLNTPSKHLTHYGWRCIRVLKETTLPVNINLGHTSLQ